FIVLVRSTLLWRGSLHCFRRVKNQMNTKIEIVRQQAVALLNIALLLTSGPSGPGIARAEQRDAPRPDTMPSDELDPLVGPIALYPDPVLAQVLSAATFPSDLVVAGRWSQPHK